MKAIDSIWSIDVNADFVENAWHEFATVEGSLETVATNWETVGS
jgi:peroxiredoxin